MKREAVSIFFAVLIGIGLVSCSKDEMKEQQLEIRSQLERAVGYQRHALAGHAANHHRQRIGIDVGDLFGPWQPGTHLGEQSGSIHHHLALFFLAPHRRVKHTFGLPRSFHFQQRPAAGPKRYLDGGRERLQQCLVGGKVHTQRKAHAGNVRVGKGGDPPQQCCEKNRP